MSLSFAAIYMVLAILVLALCGGLLYERRRLLQSELERSKRERALLTAERATRDGESQLLHLRREIIRFGRLSMIGELSTAVAHELNQPLTAILSNAQAGRRMLEARNDASELYQILGDIVADDRRAISLIERLREMLAVSEPERSITDLACVVREVLAYAHSTLTARNVAVSTRLPRAVPQVMIHRVQIQQVLLNLVLNASDAMSSNRETEPRALCIRISTVDEGFVLVSVSNTGPKIPAESYESLFTPFFSTKNGLGLGLAISKSIVDAHGGRIWALNNPHRGATFCFTLPAARAPASAESNVADG